MRVTIFTSNSLRHKNLINSLSRICDSCYAIVETKTIFPGQVDDFFKKTTVMSKYFKKVEKSEKFFFKNNQFINKNVKTKIIKQGDLNLLKKHDIKDALNSDLFIIFGASYIKGWLIRFLIKKKALNIHMGLSPFYRGSSCNFWAIHDNKPEYVGATIHLLSKGLDSGKILYHCLPDVNYKDIFKYTMSSVLSAQKCLVKKINEKKLMKIKPIDQNKKYEIRYTKKTNFSDKAIKFLNRNRLNILKNNNQIKEKINKLNLINSFKV